MHARQLFTNGLLVGVALLLLGACGRASASPQQATLQLQINQSLHITSAHVTLTSAFPSNHIRPFDKTTTDPTQAQRLYDATLALPVMPSGTYFCPMDRGEVLHLTFYDGAALVARASVKPDGCEGAILPDGSKRWAATDDSFWTTLTQAFDVSRSAFNLDSTYTGPSAPTAVAGQP